jgi:hypothetical protein
MSANWDVEDAIEEVIAAIREGSALRIGRRVRKYYENLYWDDFESQWEKGADWYKARKRVLPLAVLVGALASVLTIVRAVINLDPVPYNVDRKSAADAAWFVAHSDLCVDGAFCTQAVEGLKTSDEDSVKRAKAFAALIANLEPRSGRSRPSGRRAPKRKPAPKPRSGKA